VIVKKTWQRGKGFSNIYHYTYTLYLLLGIIPLFIKRVDNWKKH